jgi:hypothetical protein
LRDDETRLSRRKVNLTMGMLNNASQFERQGFPWPLPDAKRELREAATTKQGFAEFRAGPIAPPAAPVVHGDPDNVNDARRDINAAIADFEARKAAERECRRAIRSVFDLPPETPKTKAGKYANPKLGHGLGHARNFKDDPNQPLSAPPREPGVAPDSAAAKLARLYRQRQELNAQIARLESKL